MDILQYFCDDTIENFKIINEISNKQNFNVNDKLLQLLDNLNQIHLDKNIINHIHIKLHKCNTLNLNNNIFISDDIKQQANNIIYKYEINIKLLNLNLNLYVLDKKDNINLKILIDIYLWLSSFKKNNKKLLIDIYLLPNKKLLNGEYVLGKNHVNSGSTTNRKYIQIWRKEELFKVFIHELIHFFKYDFIDNTNITTKCIKEKINIDKSCRILPNEAYVDTWTIILHSIYIANRLKKPVNDILTYEIYFCLYQTAKIIKHYGFLKMEDLFDKNFNKYIMQTTSVFSYYIIKSSLLFNLDKFLNFTKKFNFIIFNQTEKNLQKFNSLIFECLTDLNFHREINKIIPLIQNSTLRMSLFELKN
jgi:hypothetical protein